MLTSRSLDGSTVVWVVRLKLTEQINFLILASIKNSWRNDRFECTCTNRPTNRPTYQLKSVDIG